ncbi:hypothetical protein VNI00_013393 [Paramarasmius palmivorus]|uniref:Uncharacterized protein n=1 Tax=Paramarasmius palmivorus TaxID=297713 RepID=A0AAW0C1R6_9AGAR
MRSCFKPSVKAGLLIVLIRARARISLPQRLIHPRPKVRAGPSVRKYNLPALTKKILTCLLSTYWNREPLLIGYSEKEFLCMMVEQDLVRRAFGLSRLIGRNILAFLGIRFRR